MVEDRLLGLNEERDKKSLYSGGIQYLMRIDEILQRINNVSVFNPEAVGARIKGLVLEQHQARANLLKVLYFEIYPRLNEEERKRNDEALNVVERFVGSVYSALEEAHRTKAATSITHEFVYKMDNWERELRHLVNKKGLLMPNKAGSDEATSL